MKIESDAETPRAYRLYSLRPYAVRWWKYILLASLSFFGALLIATATSSSPIISSDSVEFIVSARNLLDGKGLGLVQASGEFVPLGLHPPLYSIILAIGGGLGGDLIAIARVTNFLLFGLLVFLVGASFLKTTGSLPLAVLAACLTIISPALIGSALLSGLALISRYNGIAFVFACTSGVLLLSDLSLKRRIRATAIYAGLALLPIAAWVIWLRLQQASSWPRGFELGEGNLWYRLNEFRVAIAGAAFRANPHSIAALDPSYSQKLGAVCVVALAVATIVVLSIRSQGLTFKNIGKGGPDLSMVILLGLYLLGFGIVMALAYLFASPPPDINQRLFFPFTYGVLLTILAAGSVADKSLFRRSWIAPVLIVIYVFGLIPQFPQIREQLGSLSLNPPGYGSHAWRNSKTINAILELPKEVPIIASDTAGILLWTNKPAYDIPELIDQKKVDRYLPLGSNPDSGVDSLFRESGAALVMFRSGYWQFFDIYHEETVARLDAMFEGLYHFGDLEDGSIYFYNKESAPDA